MKSKDKKQWRKIKEFNGICDAIKHTHIWMRMTDVEERKKGRKIFEQLLKLEIEWKILICATKELNRLQVE